MISRSAFVQSEESVIASTLLDAFEQGDQELLEETVKRQHITFLNNEIAKLARTLQVPGGISKHAVKRPPPPQPPQAFLWNHAVDTDLHGQEKEFDESDYVSSYMGDEKEDDPAPLNHYPVPPGSQTIHPTPNPVAPIETYEDELDGGLC